MMSDADEEDGDGGTNELDAVGADDEDAPDGVVAAEENDDDNSDDAVVSPAHDETAMVALLGNDDDNDDDVDNDSEHLPKHLNDCSFPQIPHWIKAVDFTKYQYIHQIHNLSIQEAASLSANKESKDSLRDFFNFAHKVGEGSLSKHPLKNLIVDVRKTLLEDCVKLKTDDPDDDDEAKYIRRTIRDLSFVKEFIQQFEEVFIKNRDELKRNSLIDKEISMWKMRRTHFMEEQKKKKRKETAEHLASSKKRRKTDFSKFESDDE